MEWHKSFGVKVTNFKCFGEQPSGFDRIELFNVIIGRNNSGKSALIDVVEQLTRTNFDIHKSLWHKGASPDFIASHAITEENIRKFVPENESTPGLPGGGNQRNCCAHYLGSLVSKKLNSPHEFVSISNMPDGMKEPEYFRDPRVQNKLAEILARTVSNPFASKKVRRLLAERHVVPEKEGEVALEPNGDGATNLIKSVLLDSDKDASLIEAVLMEAINEIFNPDLEFSRLIPQRIDKGSNTYEIFIEEIQSGPVALSESGSGIKTVILVLLNLLVVPHLTGSEVGDCIFAFEELENNLHPALLRRLLMFLHRFALENRSPIFLTTHSSVAIDMLTQQECSQLIHVVHDRAEYRSVASTVHHFGHTRAVLDDLDIRASDLLQSNGVIWVEGSSDKIYMNRWIELMSRGKLQENIHYQILFYGGKLLSHMTACDDSDENWISILTVNRNCCIVMDSDLDAESEPIRPTKQRLKAEVLSAGGIAWVTRGREIENYLPASVVGAVLGKEVRQTPAFTKFDRHIKAVDEKWGKSFAKKKVQFAAEISSKLDLSNAFGVLDLQTRVSELCRAIAGWNRTADPITAVPPDAESGSGQSSGST